jgi:hypothetical protein
MMWHYSIRVDVRDWSGRPLYTFDVPASVRALFPTRATRERARLTVRGQSWVTAYDRAGYHVTATATRA